MTISSSQALAGGGVEHRGSQEGEADCYEDDIEHANLMRADANWSVVQCTLRRLKIERESGRGS